MMDMEKVRANVEVLKYCAARIAELKEMQATSRAVVEEALGDNEIGTLDGEEVVSYKHVKSRRLDQKALKEHYPDVAEECMTTVESRRFEVK